MIVHGMAIERRQEEREARRARSPVKIDGVDFSCRKVEVFRGY